MLEPYETVENREGDQSFAAPKYALWDIDYLKLVTFKKQKTQDLWPSPLPPWRNSDRNTYLRKGTIHLNNSP